MVSRSTLKLVALGSTALLGTASLIWHTHEKKGRGHVLASKSGAMIDAACTLNRGSAMLALSVLLDSGMEHYRGEFKNRAMYTPLVLSTCALLASGHGVQDQKPSAHRLRDPIYLCTALSGVVGTGFHLYNLTKRPGSFSWTNLFYSAPLGAPAALVLSGVLGFYSERVRDAAHSPVPRVLGLPADKAVALMAAAGLLGTAAEAGLLHFRGSFQNPAMYLPVTAPPLAAGLLAATAMAGPEYPRLRWFSRLWLRFTTLMGLAGAGFHAFGIARNHNGWRNWRQNLLVGPPLPAPPSFTGLSLAGLAAHTLMKKSDHWCDSGAADDR